MDNPVHVTEVRHLANVMSARANRKRKQADVGGSDLEDVELCDRYAAVLSLFAESLEADSARIAAPPPAFWLVWREPGKPEYVPTKRHTEASAEHEAERLAEQHPGVRFFVVPASRFTCAEIMPVKWCALDVDIEDGEVLF